MAKLAGKSGQIYIASTLIDNGDVIWTDGTNGTAALETTIKKAGIGSAKVTVGAGISAGDVVYYHAIAAGATNYSTFTHALCWARCDHTTSADDFRLCIDKDAGLPDESTSETLMSFPILTANTWKYCHLTDVTGQEIADSTAGLIVGVEAHAGNGSHSGTVLYLDEIRAAKTVLGINSWNLDYVTDALETTDFSVEGVRAYVVGASGWSGSFAGYKDGAPLSMGEIYGVELAESATATQMWMGSIIITGVHPSVAFDGTVNYSYDFTGTADLSVATT
jgi:hypothetical protein